MTDARLRAKMTFCLTRWPAKAIARFRSSPLTYLRSCEEGSGSALRRSNRSARVARPEDLSNHTLPLRWAGPPRAQVSILRKRADGLKTGEQIGARKPNT